MSVNHLTDLYHRYFCPNRRVDIFQGYIIAVELGQKPISSTSVDMAFTRLIFSDFPVLFAPGPSRASRVGSPLVNTRSPHHPGLLTPPVACVYPFLSSRSNTSYTPWEGRSRYCLSSGRPLACLAASSVPCSIPRAIGTGHSPGPCTGRGCRAGCALRKAVFFCLAYLSL
jgi:hypothetical protein